MQIYSTFTLMISFIINTLIWYQKH